MEIVHNLLKQHGKFSEEVLSKLERWDKIDFLRKFANEAVKKKKKTPEDIQLIKYSRNTRMTTEKQKEKYQKDINKYFMKMISTLSSKNSSGIDYAEDVQVQENLEELMRKHHEDLVKYEKMVESDEE